MICYRVTQRNADERCPESDSPVDGSAYAGDHHRDHGGPPPRKDTPMRVPSDPDNPTYDHTFKVGFWRWLTSSGPERKEWARRRNAAIPTSRSIRKIEQAGDWAERKQAEREARRNNPGG